MGAIEGGNPVGVEPGTYALVPVTAGATVTAEKKWHCAEYNDYDDGPPCWVESAAESTDYEQQHQEKCGWVWVVTETIR